MQIPPIRITTKGETYFINKATGSTNNRQPINEEHGNTDTNETNMEITEDNDGNNELTHHEESWRVATSSKKRKVTPCTSGRKAVVADKKQWLQDITLSNSLSALPEETVTDSIEKPTTRIAKPPPIYIDAQIIDPLIEFLNNTAGKDSYSIKQIKVDQMKVQTNTPDTFRKVTKSLKEKNAGCHTYQLKADQSYKAVIRGLHLKTNTDNISEELAKIGHHVRSINNITRYDTKQPLPLFLIELEPKNNNKEIYKIKKCSKHNSNSGVT